MTINTPTAPAEETTRRDAQPAENLLPRRADDELLRRWPAEELLAANLDALRQQDARATEAVAVAQGGECAVMAVANDGSVSFRVQGADGSREWLGRSSTPLISAEANVHRTDVSGANLAMNTLGNGADAEKLLRKMSSSQALFVIDGDALRINLVFQLRDFSEAIRAGRLVLLLADDVAGALVEFLGGHCGYGLVDRTVAWTWLSDQDNQVFANRVASAMDSYSKNLVATATKLLADRGNRPDQHAESSQVAERLSPERIDELRVANILQAGTPVNYYSSRDILDGAAQLGASTDWIVPNRPDAVSNVAQIRRLDRLGCDLIVLTDLLRSHLGGTLPASSVCVTLLRQGPGRIFEAADENGNRLGEFDFICPARHKHAEMLRRAGYPEDRIILLPEAANTKLFSQTEPSQDDRPRFRSDVALVADRSSTDPDKYEIHLPTHQQLLKTVCELISRDCGRYHRDLAGEYLSKAERCGVTLNAEDLRQYFTELISNNLAETALYDTYCLAAAKASVNLKIWGHAPLYYAETADWRSFWHESCVADCYAGSVDYGSELNKLYNSAKIHLCISSDPYAQWRLMNGVAAGAFFLVKSHPKHKAQDGLGTIFELGRELITFDTPADLVGKIRYYLKNESQRRQIARRARQKVLAEHSWQIRLGRMLDIISQRLSG